MTEIIIKNNINSLRVYINGVPNLEVIPKDEVESVIAALELQISEHCKRDIRKYE